MSRLKKTDNYDNTNNSLREVLEDLLSRNYEEDWFEFKENWFVPHQLGEYISGMSNVAAMVGQPFAYFVWGITDDAHQVVGTSFDYHQDVKNEPLEHYLARQIKPDLDFKFRDLTLRGERVVVLIIPAAKNVPTAFDRSRYYRIGSSKVNLADYPEREAQLFMALRGEIPTLEKTASEYQDLSFNKLFAYYGSRGITLNKRTFKKNLNLLTADGKYNVMAQLLSDNSQIPIRFGLFTGKTKASPMYAVREFGNDCLLYSLDGILRYGEVLNVPQADERNRVVERKEVMLFDQDAYREAVLNAFVHNHWLEGAPAFTVFQDRIEILSRGTLPPKQTLDGFFAGESVPVNEKLAKIILQLHISEQTGRGVPAIVDVYGREAFRLAENNIKVTIPFERISDGVNAPVAGEIAQVTENNTPVTEKNTPVTGKNTPVAGKNTPVAGKNTPVATSVGAEKTSTAMRILEYCNEPRGITDIASYLGYKEKKSVRKHLQPLLEQGRIAMTIPEKPNSRLQKYITIK